MNGGSRGSAGNVQWEKNLAREISEIAETSAGEKVKAQSRYVPSEVRERVLDRASHQCQFTARDGTRCTARTGLEIEHERPFALFHRHNLFQAERVYGPEFMRAKINGKKGREGSQAFSQPFAPGTTKTRPQ